MNGEMFRTVSLFRQHVAAVDPLSGRATKTSLILSLLIMTIEMLYLAIFSNLANCNINLAKCNINVI